MKAVTEVEAKEYLEKHKILPLFEKLCSELILNKPADPRAFLIEQIKSIPVDPVTKKENLSLFNEDDVDAMFSMLDPVGQGFINGTQLETGLHFLV